MLSAAVAECETIPGRPELACPRIMPVTEQRNWLDGVSEVDGSRVSLP